jgi:hypothetical protein
MLQYLTVVALNDASYATGAIGLERVVIEGNGVANSLTGIHTHFGVNKHQGNGTGANVGMNVLATYLLTALNGEKECPLVGYRI